MVEIRTKEVKRHMNSKQTRYIILRKTPYHETSLILAGISSEYGRIDLLIRGAKKIGSKTLPAIDLFREIEISINPKKEGLQTIYSAELVSNFDNIAMHKNSYLDSCEISRFILRNSHPGIPSPLTYTSIRIALQTLAISDKILYSPMVKLVFLEEHGLLPRLPAHREEEIALLEQLLSAAKGESKIPELPTAYMKEIAEWIESLCKYNEL
jgi:DNA repair protein RecO